MFKQIATPTEEELCIALGDDYLAHWHQDKVTHWLEEKGWGLLAPQFRDHGICHARFFKITLAELVKILPRPITSYAERRRLLNDIRSLGAPEGNERPSTPAAPANISINTNLHTFSGDTFVSAGTPNSGQPPSSSPATPSSGATTAVASATASANNSGVLVSDHPRDNGANSLCTLQYSAGTSPSPSPSSSDFTQSLARSSGNSTRNSPTRSYSPKAAFSKLRNTLLSHSAHTPPPLPSAPLISPRTSSMNYDTSVFDETPTIPARVSSTPEKISKFWASYAHWHHPSASRAKQQQSGVADKEARHSPHKHTTANADQRIQVTGDRDTWYSLTVTDVRDPDRLKDLILKRMQLPGDRDQYCYFHENGPEPDTPLEPQELLALCSAADHLASDRILVEQIQQRPKQFDPTRTMFSHRPPSRDYKQLRNHNTAERLLIDQAVYGNGTFTLSTPELGHSPSETPNSPQISVMGYSPSSPNAKQIPSSPFHGSFVFPASPSSNSHRPLHRHSALTSRPTRRPPVQLTDPPTPQQLKSYTMGQLQGEVIRGDDDQTDQQIHESENGNGSCQEFEDILYQRQRTGSVPFLATSSSDDTKASTRRSEPFFDRVQVEATAAQCKNMSVGLWAVPPKKSCPDLTNSGTSKGSDQLWAVAPSKMENNIPHRTDSASPENDGIAEQKKWPHIAGKRGQDRPTSPHGFWGERPPAEVVFQHMEKYFDAHDLDKEVVVDTPPPASAGPRRLAHTKSIRLVAREASKKYRKEGVRSGSGNVLRRKSTKLWGQRVVEVKPQKSIGRLPSLKEQHLASNGSIGGAGNAVQWIRGKLIGKGSFGRVYLAFNVATGDVIAVKQVEMPKTQSDVLDMHQQDVVQALYQEMAMLRDLDHDNIVQYLGYGQDDGEGVVHIFLEYVSGGSIASRLVLQGAFEEQLVRHFSRQICLGLAYLHSKNILHRDIKAANILVEADGVCKISDFGLSKKNDYDGVYDQNSRMSLRGSVYWMAPEVVKNEPYSAKVDIWSLGCTVIEMFTGQRPWMTFNQIAALYNLGRHNTPDIPTSISEEAKDFLQKCFIIDPAERPTASVLLAHPFCQADPHFDFKEFVDKGKV